MPYNVEMQIGTLEAQLVADVRRFRNDMNMAKRSFDSVATSMDTGSRRSIASLAKIEGAVGGVNTAVHGLTRNVTRSMSLIGAAWVIPQMFGTAKDAIFGFNQQMDSAMLSLTTFAGASKAGALMEDLKIFGATTPFNFKDLLGTTGQMMAMGVAADELIPRLTAIGDAAAAMGGSAYTLQRVQRALGQIQMKGRAQAEELLQLAEAGIPAYKYMAEIAGGSMEEVLRMMKKGQVTAEQAIGAIVEGMSRDFGGMMEEQSKMMHGAVSNVQDFMEITVATMGRGLYEEVRDIAVGMADILGSTEVQAWGTQFAENVAKSIRQVKGLVETVVDQVGPAFAESFKLAYETVESLAGSLDAAIPVIIAFAAPLKVIAEVFKTFAVIAQPIVALVGSIDMLSDVIVQGLVAAIGFAILKKKIWVKTMYEVDGQLVKGNRALRRAAADIRETGVNAVQTDRAFARLSKGVGNMALGTHDAVRSIGTMGNRLQKTQTWMNALAVSARNTAKAFKGFFAANAPMLALTAAIGVGLKVWGDYRARQEENQRQVEALTVSIQEQTKALQENYDAAAQVEKGAVGGGDLDYKLRIQLLGDDTGKELKKRIEETMGGIGQSFDFSAALFGDLGFGTHMDSLKTELMSVQDQMAAFAAPHEVMPPELIERAAALRKEMENVNKLQAEWTQLLSNTAGVIESHTLELIGQGVITEESLRLAKERVQTQMVENDQASRLVAIGYGALDIGYERQLLEEAIKVELELQAKAAADLAAEQAIGAGILTTMTEAARGGTTAFERMWNAWKFDKKKAEFTPESVAAYFAEFVEGSDRSARGLLALADAQDDLVEKARNLGGSQKELQRLGYELQDQLVSQIAAMRNLGIESAEAERRAVQLALSFAGAAENAGYSTRQVKQLLDALGLLEALPQIDIVIGLDAEALKKELAEIVWALADLASLGGGGLNKELEHLAGRFDAIATRLHQIQRKSVSQLAEEEAAVDSAGSAVSEYENALRAAQNLAESFLAEMKALGDFVASDQFRGAMVGTADQIESAFQRLIDTISTMGPHTQLAVQEAVGAMRTMVDQQKMLADERDVLLAGYYDQQQQTDAAGERVDYIKSLISTEMDAIDTLLNRAGEAQYEMQNLQQELASLRVESARYSDDVAQQNTMSVVTNTNTEVAGWLDYVNKFVNQLEQLQGAGWPSSIIQEVISLGVKDGYHAAKRLLSMSDSERSQTIDLAGRMDAAAGRLGDFAAENSGYGRVEQEIELEIESLQSTIDGLLGEALTLAEEEHVRQQGYLEVLQGLLDENELAMQDLATAIQSEFALLMTSLESFSTLFPESMREIFTEAIGNMDSTLAQRVGELNAAIASGLAGINSAASAAAESVSAAGASAVSSITSAREESVQSSARTEQKVASDNYHPITSGDADKLKKDTDTVTTATETPKVETQSPDPYHPITSGDAEKEAKKSVTAPTAFFAEGGIVDRPTNAVMGEAGPEAIIPLDKLKQFIGMPESKPVDPLSRAFESHQRFLSQLHGDQPAKMADAFARESGGESSDSSTYITNEITVYATAADPESVVEALRRYNDSHGTTGGFSF